MRANRVALPAGDVHAASRAIADRVTAHSTWREVRTIHTYVGALPGEITTDWIIERAFEDGKRVLVPVAQVAERTMRSVVITDLDDLQTTSWGGREPVSGDEAKSADIDLIIVPGVAFDRAGCRLGMGAGFYDRLLSDLSVPKIGLAHNWQVVEAVPQNDLDERVDAVATPSELIISPGVILDLSIRR